MKVVVSLKDVVDGLECVSDTRTAHLNRRTGEVITIGDGDIQLVESASDPEDMTDWERDLLPTLREALESDDSLALPDNCDINEYSIIQRFCYTIEDVRLQEEFLSAIAGKGAFSRFRHLVNNRSLQERWHRFQRAALEDVAIEWLERNKIPYHGARTATTKHGA